MNFEDIKEGCKVRIAVTCPKGFAIGSSGSDFVPFDENDIEPTIITGRWTWSSPLVGAVQTAYGTIGVREEDVRYVYDHDEIIIVLDSSFVRIWPVYISDGVGNIVKTRKSLNALNANMLSRLQGLMIEKLDYTVWYDKIDIVFRLTGGLEFRIFAERPKKKWMLRIEVVS